MSGRGVLLDVDGTLIDNSYLHTVAWYRALRRHGRTEKMARLHRLVGMGGDMYTRELFGEVREDLAEAHGEELAAFRDDMVPLPGARELIECVRGAGLQVVLSTSASVEDAKRFVAMIGADGMVDHAATAEDVRHTKPSPDIVVAALQKSGLRPDDAVFVGDTRWDVEAAARAKVACVAVETGGWAPGELRDAGAAAVYVDLVRLVEDFEASQLGQLRRR